MRKPNFARGQGSKRPNPSSKQESEMRIFDQISSNLFRVCWWNGGGAIHSPKSVNPGSNSFLKSSPHMFVDEESGYSNARGLFLSGYRVLFTLIIHKRQTKVSKKDGNFLK